MMEELTRADAGLDEACEDTDVDSHIPLMC